MALKDLVVEAFNALDSLLTPSGYNYRIPTRQVAAPVEDGLAGRQAARRNAAAVAFARHHAKKGFH